MRNVLQIIGLVIAMTLSFSNPALASNKTPLEQAELYYSWVKDSAETNWSESILKLIKNEEVTWEQLSFTEQQLKVAIRRAYVHDAEQYYVSLSRDGSGAFWGKEILKLLSAESFTWPELSFTHEELASAMRIAYINQAEKYFSHLMSDPESSILWGNSIFELIEDEKITWDELSFTEQQAKAALRRAYLLRVERLYASDTSYWSSHILSLISEGDLTWDELSFTQEELEE